MNNIIKIKVQSARALPRVWKQFFRIPTGDAFYIGSKQYLKTTPFKAVQVGALVRIWVNPFQRVKTTVLVRDIGKKTVVNEIAPKLQSQISDCALRHEGVRSTGSDKTYNRAGEETKNESPR